jgi:5-methyltetrahydropteroyltriglutamate--homocysteine methyltransferase
MRELILNRREETRMKTSTDRILTTHVGSLPRPETVTALLRARLGGQAVDDAELAARVTEAVAEMVRRQADVGLDVISDGEMGKTSFLNYTDDRLAGFVTLRTDDPNAPATSTGASWARRIDTRREWRAFREYYGEYLPRAMPPSALPSVCEGPIAYKGEASLQRELATFAAARKAVRVEECFVPAIAPGMVGRGQNRYYATEEEYVFALAEALKTEYKAIVDAGFILQIDDPGLGETWDIMIPAPPLPEYRRIQARNIDALNHALAGIPEDRVRYHLCWGSWQGPHVHDLGLRDIADLVLRVRAQAYSVEAATPRHSYEWRVWQDVKLPEGKVLIPGVIAHTTAVVEHPETVAERIETFARVVGRERVIAGADCGFAQGALYQRQHPTVMWAKFEALVEGARLASRRLF